ncbi:hypothetical protein BDV93DRAFT_513311 [Ceratobasidium sp. AG-I]|nr:hypothetical protein BDV93DRAFT_513311 [Ceratobasidium sp. AG-I]
MIAETFVTKSRDRSHQGLAPRKKNTVMRGRTGQVLIFFHLKRTGDVVVVNDRLGWPVTDNLGGLALVTVTQTPAPCEVESIRESLSRMARTFGRLKEPTNTGSNPVLVAKDPFLTGWLVIVACRLKTKLDFYMLNTICSVREPNSAETIKMCEDVNTDRQKTHLSEQLLRVFYESPPNPGVQVYSSRKVETQLRTHPETAEIASAEASNPREALMM